MGLCLLDRVPAFIERRKQLFKEYDEALKKMNLLRPLVPDNTIYNYSYYPVTFKDEETVLKVKAALEKESIFTRRYFYPSLNKLPYIFLGNTCAVSENYARRTLCLPMYYELSSADVIKISTIIIAA